MLVICGLIIAFASAHAAQTSESTGRVAGRVTAEGTNAAVAGARISLFPSGRPTRPIRPMGMPPQAITDQDGRFVFERILPGSYRVDAQKTGFAPLNQPDRPHTVDIVAGRDVVLDLQLQKGAVLSGRVVDPRGEPMSDVQILAMRRIPTSPGMTTPRLIPAGPVAQTNDLGEFRVPGLAAGEYYVAAMHGQSPFGGPGVTPSSGNAKTTITATFYPGTSDQQAAQPIAVAAGAEVGNISFAMQSAPAFRISGIVVDENSDPVDGAMLMLMGDPRGGMFLGPRGGGGQSRADGHFTIGEIPAGSYRLSASIPIRMNGAGSGGFVTFGSGAIRSGGAAGGASGGAVGAVSGGAVASVPGGLDQPTEVVVTDADLSGVRIVVRRPARQ